MRRTLGQPDDAPLIGTVARLSTQKNPRLFLEAAALVLRDQPAARFVWCGGGELRALASAYARELGIDEACCFLGHRNDAHQVLAALDYFWLTSDYEGLPLAPLDWFCRATRRISSSGDQLDGNGRRGTCLSGLTYG